MIPVSAERIRLVIVDDSVLYTEALRDALAGDGCFDVVGVAHHGREAVRQVEALRPDLVTLDLQMPDVDGLSVVSSIMASAPTPILLLTGEAPDRIDAVAFEALRRGALDVRAKPPLVGDDLRELAELKEQLSLLASVPTVHHPNLAGRGQAPVGLVGIPSRVVIGVVASTGGPSALAEVLADLPPNLPACVLVVQHLAPGFSPTFTRWLATTTKLRVTLAEEGMALEEGVVLVAPDDAHLVVRGPRRVGLEPEGPSTLVHRPSGTALLSTIAERFGPAAIGVILTGMGSDGAAGLRKIDDGGGIALVQDDQSSVVDGMPASARAAVPSARVHPLHQLGGALRQAVLEIRERSLVGVRRPGSALR